MPRVRLNGYWTKNDDQDVYVYIDRVYKAGHVTGFSYKKLNDNGELISDFRTTHQELINNYTRKERK